MKWNKLSYKLGVTNLGVLACFVHTDRDRKNAQV